MFNQINNNLIRPDLNGGSTVEVDLATSWRISADGLTYTFEIRPGVRFTDGVELKCEDVLYSFNRMRFPVTGFVNRWSNTFTAVKDIQCTSPTTIVFTMNRLWADALTNMATPKFVVYPKHVAAPNGNTGKFMNNTFIGSGAFKLKQWIPEQLFELEKNPNYFKQGLPYFDSIKGVIVPLLEPRTLSALFQSKRVQWVPQFEDAGLVAEIKAASQGRWDVREGKGLQWFQLHMDQLQPGSVWHDKQLRQGLALAICDKEFRDIAGVFAYAKFEDTPFPQESGWGLPLAEYKQIPGYGDDCAGDREKARKIFTDKKITDQEFIFHTYVNVQGDQSSLVLCDQLKKAGLKCKLNVLERANFLQFFGGVRKIPESGFVMQGAGSTNPTPDNIIQFQFLPSSIGNFSQWPRDPKDRAYLVDLYNRQSAELDTQKRRAMLWDFQRFILNNYFLIFPAWRGRAQLIWNDVVAPLGGFPLDPNYIVWETTWIKK